MSGDVRHDAPVSTSPDLLTVAEVATILRRTPDTIHRWIESGALAAVRVGPAKMIRRDTLDSLLGVASTVADVPSLTEGQIDLVRRAFEAVLAELQAQVRKAR